MSQETKIANPPISKGAMSGETVTKTQWNVEYFCYKKWEFWISEPTEESGRGRAKKLSEQNPKTKFRLVEITTTTTEKVLDL